MGTQRVGELDAQRLGLDTLSAGLTVAALKLTAISRQLAHHPDARHRGRELRAGQLYTLPVPTRAEIVSFETPPTPPGASSWVPGAAPATGIEVTEPDPAWPRRYDELAARIRDALGWRALQLEHVGSTAVPGLAAKPVIDIDLIVADPGREHDYVPALESIGFRLVIREPWRDAHRALVSDDPHCNLHVWGFDCAEPVRHRIFRDWLCGNPADRDRYAAVKSQAAAEANAAGEHVMQYNARKEQVIRKIYHQAFLTTGLLQR